MRMYFIQHPTASASHAASCHANTTRLSPFHDATRTRARARARTMLRYPQSVELSGNLLDNVTQVQSALVPRGSLRDAHASVSHRNGFSCHLGFGTISKSSDFGTLPSLVPMAFLEGSIIIVAPNGALGGGGSALGGSGRS